MILEVQGEEVRKGAEEHVVDDLRGKATRAMGLCGVGEIRAYRWVVMTRSHVIQMVREVHWELDLGQCCLQGGEKYLSRLAGIYGDTLLMNANLPDRESFPMLLKGT